MSNFSGDKSKYSCQLMEENKKIYKYNHTSPPKKEKKRGRKEEKKDVRKAGKINQRQRKESEIWY